jgi:hypothetical protein
VKERGKKEEKLRDKTDREREEGENSGEKMTE